jgi:hypothetical protein
VLNEKNWAEEEDDEVEPKVVATKVIKRSKQSYSNLAQV